ncbi:alpha/beta fold hydrolase [Rossellomorea aquimaris]|uniref:Alpha/beta hydrolase n=1 Tax=Rossellomorea aquimaris TaxID=189382 RepID=A0A1J6W9L6_9BACI|nr:alpha/beta hydrolase [Rossellomorea aquimaris]OIU68568.1 alpha/beta hydrolase [Rossellomorea aquimaris]
MKQGTLHKIRGKYLHIEEYGSHNQEAILYLHGGPGESCYDFSFHQAAKLQEQFRLIAIDQRGVCRSEGIETGEAFGLMDLIEDCEELRKILQIEKWSLIGHSFGGFLSVLYTSIYPNSIHKVILECPTFDFELTSRSLLRKTALLSRELNNDEIAKKCLSLADSEESISIQELTEKYLEYSDTLESERMKIYRFNFDNPTDYSLYSDEEWNRLYDKSDVHFDLLRKEGEIFKSLLPLFEEIHHEMLLMQGEHDPVTCDKQVEAFNKSANGRTYMFYHCGHSPHYEQPDEFREVVGAFLTGEPAVN